MNLDPLIDNITAGQVIPIIGHDLCLVHNYDDKPVPLENFIASELTRKLNVPYTGQSISELAFAYPQDNVMLTTYSIYDKIDEDRFYLEPLKKLAGITDFKFLVSTTLDDLLEKSLRKTRNLKDSRLKVLDYSLQQFAQPPGEYEEKPLATVFNLLGSFNNVIESAFNEEETLEHIFSLSDRYNRHPLAEYFAQQIKNKILLFIGCDYPDWFMRFVIRILTNQRYKSRIFSDYIVCDKCTKSPELNKFLKQFNKNIVAIEGVEEGQSRAFVDQLYEKWMDFQENRPIQYDGSVFLSYNHPDQEKVNTLKKLLKAKGVRNAWFDIENLDAGEHKTLIEDEIKKCKVFVPLISNNSLTNNQSYTWKVEWAGIEVRLMADKYYGKKSFQMVPIILDDTERNDERIPPYMRDFSIWNLDKNKDRIVEEITKELTPL
ncbi:MAG: toll/interleukin-1 receptor domain-containing protein [Candidatus Aminicenantes bacterium]|nr:toll/interleukin-1 receptor domain-containing protein [Candidatus Aminicenantes bacterium]